MQQLLIGTEIKRLRQKIKMEGNVSDMPRLQGYFSFLFIYHLEIHLR